MQSMQTNDGIVGQAQILYCINPGEVQVDTYLAKRS